MGIAIVEAVDIPKPDAKSLRSAARYLDSLHKQLQASRDAANRMLKTIPGGCEEIITLQLEAMIENTRTLDKAISGLIGQSVSFHNDTLFVDGMILTLPAAAKHADRPTLQCRNSKAGHREIRVTKGQVFVVGDNRSHSSDSRIWGAVSQRYIKGRAMLICFSWTPASKVVKYTTSASSPQKLIIRLATLTKRVRWSRMCKLVT